VPLPQASSGLPSLDDVGPRRRRQRRHGEIRRVGNVEDQFGEATRRGDDSDPAPGRAFDALAGRQHFGEFDEVRHRDGAMRPQQLRGRCGLAGRSAGMARDGLSAARAATDLQHDDRFAQESGAVERGDKPIGMADRLDECPDHLGLRIFDEIVEVIGSDEHGFVAGRDDVAEAEASRIGQEADAERAALRDDADIPGQTGRIAQLLQVGGAAMMRAEDAHAVGAAQRDAAFAAEIGNFALQKTALLVLFGKTAVVDDGRLDAALCRRGKGVANPRMADAEHRNVRRLGQIGKARIAGMAEDARIGRIDREDRAGEADPIERGDDPAPDRRLFRGADNGDRAGLKQRCERHRLRSAEAPAGGNRRAAPRIGRPAFVGGGEAHIADQHVRKASKKRFPYSIRFRRGLSRTFRYIKAVSGSVCHTLGSLARFFVIPAPAGIQGKGRGVCPWTPAFAGATT